ncbi:subtilisin-like protease SBT3 [Mangifera indica]|uniref:subtilisin-like protease SBT3 n=1 Tax=Mangifera indica TaxID=29780 RepID=UPI001CF9AC6B|nr:subtilisin-like protease SBT3 [Mangifera indica]
MATHKLALYGWFSLILILHLISASEPDNYIVYMDLSAMPKAFSAQHHWYSATLQSVSTTVRVDTNNRSSILSSSKLLYSYSHVINGFSASLTPAELEVLKTSPGYISSVRDLPVKLDTTHSSQFIGLTSKSGLWPESKYGQDVIIGVIDTGVWPESESFNDRAMTEIPSRWKGECETGTQFNSSLCNKKLIGARFFNRGLIAHYPNITISMNSTRDTDGHGTHTSSTAAGSPVEGASYFDYAAGTATGMAPQARVAMYKAIWDGGGVISDIIAAIDQAIIDGVDVLSMSLGLDGLALYEDPLAIATFAAIEKNIFVSTSAGNRGPFFKSLHNGIPWVLTVAAGTMDREFGAILTLGSGVQIKGSSLYPRNVLSQVPIVFMDDCLNLNELKKVGIKIVVCQDKNDSLSDQVENIRNAKVAAGVFISDSDDLEFFLQTSFPAIFMNPKNADIIINYIKSNSDPKASIEFQKTDLGVKPAPLVTSYSSRGPSPSCPLVLKPDIMAPGDLVLAAWPDKTPVTVVNSELLFSKFNLLSGTSMACPHAAGIAALLKGVHPEWSPAAIRSAIMTTSDSIDNTNTPIKDAAFHNEPASPLAMGAGQINPNNALDPGLIYDATLEEYVSLLCALNFTMKQIQTITRSSSTNCSVSSLDINYPSFIAFYPGNDSKSGQKSTVQEFKRTVTNVGEGISTYSATVITTKGFKVNVIPDKLVFKEKYEKQSFKLIIEGPTQMEDVVNFGYLLWADIVGKHLVKSPIVVTSLSTDNT